MVKQRRAAIHTVSRVGRARTQARTRLALLGFFACLPLCLIVMRLADLSLLTADDTITKPLPPIAQRITEEKPQFRADILDRNGEILATSLRTRSLYADPSLIENAQDVAAALSAILSDQSSAELQKKLSRQGRFVWVKRAIAPAQAQKIHDLGIPGLGFRKEYRRFYPKQNLTAHMVGYAGIDGEGLAGIESAYDTRIRGVQDPLKLTMDVRIQNSAWQAVSYAMKRFEAKAGMAMVVDIKRNELLAAVSLPDYDPHKPGVAPSDARFNRYMQGNYELGSTFKLFSTAAFLEHVDPSLSRRLDATKPLASGRFRISDYHAQNRYMSVPEVFMHSSNIGVALMGQELGTKRLQGSYKKFGFFDPVDLPFIEKSNPLTPKPWRSVHDLTASFGHGLAVSPLHVASAASAIMNDGVMMPLQVLAGKDGDVIQRRVVSKDVAKKMQALMRLTVSEGTGGNAAVSGYSVGGKTGSAEKPGVGGYDRDRLLSSFLGAYPMTDPQYLVYVVIDEPQGQSHSYNYATGGWVAAPAVAQIIHDINRIYMIAPVPQHHDAALTQNLYQYLDKPAPQKASYGHE